jgi:transposase
MGVIIGVDPHKASCTAAVLDERGELVDQQRFATTRTGSRALRRWAKRWPERRWAIEGASGLCRRLAQQLATDGEHVVDVPAKLAARVRLLSAGHGRKSDAHDAVSVAVAAHGARRLGQVRLDDNASVLRLLSDRRDDLVRARTQTLNRLHVLLAELLLGGAKRHLDAAAALLRRLRPATAPARTRRQLAVDLVADLRALDRRIAAVEERLRHAVHQSATTLIELFGVGPILAAKLLGEVGDVRRFATKHQSPAPTSNRHARSPPRQGSRSASTGASTTWPWTPGRWRRPTWWSCTGWCAVTWTTSACWPQLPTMPGVPWSSAIHPATRCRVPSMACSTWSCG